MHRSSLRGLLTWAGLGVRGGVHASHVAGGSGVGLTFARCPAGNANKVIRLPHGTPCPLSYRDCTIAHNERGP